MTNPNEQSTERTKKCPKCKEDIQLGAKKCKHCGSDLRNWFVRHKIITAILVLFVIGLISSAANNSGSTNKSTPNSTTTTTNENADQTNTNIDEQAADNNQAVNESGTTDSAGADQNSTPTITEDEPAPTSSETVSQKMRLQKQNLI